MKMQQDENDFAAASKLQVEYMDLIDALFIEVNPIPIKAAMNLMDMNAGELRLPLCNPTGSPLHDLRDPQRKPEDSRDKDGREKGGKEKGPEGDGKRHTGHRRVLQTKNPQGVAVNSLGGRLKDSIKVGHSISSFYWSG